MFKLAVDESLFKVLNQSIDGGKAGSMATEDLVKRVQKIHSSIQQIIKDIQKAKEGEECPISLSGEDMKHLQELQLLSRKANVDLNPIRFLFHAYEPKFWYWEIIELVRRLILTAVVCVIASGSTTQIVVSMLFSMGFLFLYSTFQPYWNSDEDIAQTTGQYMIFLDMFASLVLRGGLIGASLTSIHLIDAALVIFTSSLAIVQLFLPFYDRIVDHLFSTWMSVKPIFIWMNCFKSWVKLKEDIASLETLLIQENQYSFVGSKKILVGESIISGATSPSVDPVPLGPAWESEFESESGSESEDDSSSEDEDDNVPAVEDRTIGYNR